MTDEKLRTEELLGVIRQGRRLVVFLHDNPDPDTILSGWLLARLAAHAGRPCRIVYGGNLGRAENRTMVRLLRIPIERLDGRTIHLVATDRFALVDTKPGTGNNSFPHTRLRAHIVFDHHPGGPRVDADFVDLADDEGSCAARLYQYHRALELPLDKDLATGLAYAIISETQDLEREAGPGDVALYQSLLPHVRLPVLGAIRHPSRDREYFRTVARAMANVEVSQHVLVCHIGEVPYPEVVAEIADFLVAMERVTWALVTGRHGDKINLSLRTTRVDGHAEQVMRRLLRGLGRGGGHGSMAGGAISAIRPGSYARRCQTLTRRLLAALPYRNEQRLRPLLDQV